jgi:hypothetical protein
MTNSSIVTRWAGIKSAIKQESTRILEEYSRAKSRAKALCGQEIDRLARLRLGANGNVAVFILNDDQRQAEIEIEFQEPFCGVHTFWPARAITQEHWPGKIEAWGKALEILKATGEEEILSAWERET